MQRLLSNRIGGRTWLRLGKILNGAMVRSQNLGQNNGMSSKKESSHKGAHSSQTSSSQGSQASQSVPRKAPSLKRFDGVRSVAEMLNVMDPAARSKLLAEMQKQNPQITEAVRQRMFIFQDLVRLPSKSLQTLLREVPQPRLVLSLRSVSEEFKAVLFKNLSARAAQLLQEEIEGLGPQRLVDVTAAQNEIVKIARQLVAEGKIALEESE